MALHYLPILARRAAPKPPRELKCITKPAWSPLTRPLHQMQVALITSGAIREGNQRPFPHLGDASYRRVSSDPAVTDVHIDHRSHFGASARKDPEMVFPRRALKTLADQGFIGSVAPSHYSIYGGIRLYSEIEEKLAPALIRHLVRESVDFVVLAPY